MSTLTFAPIQPQSGLLTWNSYWPLQAPSTDDFTPARKVVFSSACHWWALMKAVRRAPEGGTLASRFGTVGSAVRPAPEPVRASLKLTPHRIRIVSCSAAGSYVASKPPVALGPDAIAVPGVTFCGPNAACVLNASAAARSAPGAAVAGTPAAGGTPASVGPAGGVPPSGWRARPPRREAAILRASWPVCALPNPCWAASSIDARPPGSLSGTGPG